MVQRRVVFVSLLVLVVSLLSLGAPSRTATAQGERCFGETGFCISGRIREFWEQNGGLPVFGFPIGPQQQETIEGKPLQVQRFERNRLELHPENARPYDVLLGRLGPDLLTRQGRDWNTAFPKESGQAGCRFFPETGHNVCGAILGAWRANGLELDGRRGKTEAENLALFGLPLSGLVTETLSDGKQYQVQWFERARFELHPENAPPYNVLLGLLGREVDNSQPPPPPVNYILQPQRGPRGTSFVAVARGFSPGERVGVYLTTPNGAVYGAPFQIGANDRGVSEPVIFRTINDPLGRWSFTFEGVSSGRKVIGSFEVFENSGDGSLNATVDPKRGPRGTVFRARGEGFFPGEQIGVYVTGPNGNVIGAPFQVVANEQGVSEAVIFTSVSSSEAGKWAFTFEGVTSRNKGIVFFEITP